MKLAFDLDGTLYDTLPVIFEVDRKMRETLGYPKITQEHYRNNFQTKDWNKFYSDLGISERDIQRVVNHFVQGFMHTEPPILIPGGKEAIAKAESALGSENIFFITNDPKARVIKRFQRDGLEHLLPRVENPFQGKSKEIYDLAHLDSSKPFIYIGDLVSDGEDCAKARKMGAKNVFFYGMTHQYAMNNPETIKRFVSQNSSFAKTLKTINDIDTIWNQK